MAPPLKRLFLVGLCFLCSIHNAASRTTHQQWMAPSAPRLEVSSLPTNHLGLSRRDTAIGNDDENAFCNSDSFKLTTANFEDAQVSQFYLDFVNKAKEEHPQEYLDLTAPNFFAQYAWGEQNFNCHIKGPGCSRLPSCSEIAQGYRRLHPDEISNVGDVTRKIYFAVLTMNNLARYFGTVHTIFSEVLAKVGFRVDSIVNDFSPTTSPAPQHICQLVKDFYAFVFQLQSEWLLGSIEGPLRMAVSIMIATTNAKIWEAVSAGETSVHGVLNSIGEGHLHKTAPLRFTLSQDYTYGTCAVFFKDYDIDPVARAGNLRDYISKEFQRLGNVVSSQWDVLNRPALYRQNPDAKITTDIQSIGMAPDANNTMDIESMGMALWMNQSDWDQTNLSIDLDLGKFEDNMIQAFVDSLINTVWRSDRCAVKCKVDALQETWKCDASRAKTHLNDRFCPDTTTICQVQCQTVHRGIGNVERGLFGRSKLQKHDLSTQSVLESSWNTYHENGFYESDTMSFVDDVINYNHSKVALPVCKSKYTKITDFSERSLPVSLAEWMWRGRNQQMACSCGDWRSNETSLYMSALSLQPNSSDWISGNMNEMMTALCPHVLRDLYPVNRFLAFCELGIRWPKLGEIFSPQLQRDPLCESVKAQVKDLSEGEANVFFCNLMPERQEIFKKELTHIDTAGTVPPLVSHKRRCRWFMKRGPGKGKTIETIGW